VLQIGIDFEGVDLADQGQTSASGAYTSHLAGSLRENATIFITGMRGAGKTYLSTLAGGLLNRPVVDADDFFTEEIGEPISDYVAKHGWPAFREIEREHLAYFIKKRSEGWIISLGGGVVETPACRELLKAYLADRGVVVHVFREIDEIRSYLSSTGDTALRPSYGESPMDVYQRRRPWYYECSSHDYLNYKGTMVGNAGAGPSENSKNEASRFFSLLAGLNTNRPELGVDHRTSFLALTLPDLSPALNLLEQITVGVDAVELRVDLLSQTGEAPLHATVPNIDFVALQLAALRHHITLPVIFSVRTESQGGFFPDNAIDEYFDFIRLAIRAGCEYIDIEIDRPKERVLEVIDHKGASQIIASWHDWSGAAKWSDSTVAQKYQQCCTIGDIAKLVGTATEPEDNTALAVFVAQTRKTSEKPILAINMGKQGQMSRIMNPILTPVTHPALPTPSAPGQMSFSQIQQALHLLGHLPSRKYYLFGTPIQASLSPVIHNSGFEALGLPHQYSLHETPELDLSISRILSDPEFGGASVTIPHKLAIMPHLTSISDDARAIGAVNTITVKYNDQGTRVLFGDNSDWKAIRSLSFRRMPPTVRITDRTTGLVIGAGGTCRAAVYAIHKLGIKTIYLFNRTKENAQKVADFFPKKFNIICVTSLDNLPAAKPTVIASTVPGGSTTLDESAPGLLLKPSLLSEAGGVAIEMAYRPKETALTELTKHNKLWQHVFGVEILLEQAFVQFEGWTGRRAPRFVQIAAVQAREREREEAEAAKKMVNGNGNGNVISDKNLLKQGEMMGSFPPAAQIEYSSSAPMPTQSATHTVNGNDPEVPTHLYSRLPAHMLLPGVNGQDPTPDYMRMILLCKCAALYSL
jgi:pentafunctional AROM polypeptide